MKKKIIKNKMNVWEFNSINIFLSYKKVKEKPYIQTAEIPDSISVPKTITQRIP